MALAVMLTVAGLAGCASQPGVWIFTAPWDARSDAALASGVAPRATIVSGWIALDTLGGLPEMLFADSLDADRTRRGARFALVTSYRGDRFHPEAVRALAGDAAARTRAADVIGSLTRAGGYAGVVLDLEALAPADTTALVVVIEAFAAAARRAGARAIAIAVPAAGMDAYPPRLLLPHVDRLLVMLYDLHWSGSEPGPVASPAWARETLGQWVSAAGARRIVAALPTYGYHWRPNVPTDVVGWTDVQRLAADAGVTPQRDDPSASLRLRLPNDGEVWYADAPLVAHMTAEARALGVRTVALWRLGLEDPAVWPAVGVK